MKICYRKSSAGMDWQRILYCEKRPGEEVPAGSSNMKSSSANSGRWFLLWKESAAEVHRTSGRNSCIYKTMFLSELFWLREIKEVRAWDAIKQNMKWERSEKHLFWMLGGVKWSPVGRTFDSVATSIQIFEVERNGFVLWHPTPERTFISRSFLFQDFWMQWTASVWFC